MPVQNISFNVKYVDSDNKPLTINGKTQETFNDKSGADWNYTIPTVSGYTFDHFATSGTAPTFTTGKLSGTYGPNSKDITLVYKKNTPTPPTPPEPNPTPVNPTPNPAPTPSTPTVTTQPATPGIAKKGEAVYALKKIYMYSNKDFKKSARVASYSKKPRINRPMFVVTDYATSKAGNLRYVVRDVNHHSKTAGKKGYITADYAFVRPVYYHSSHKTLMVINPRGVNEYTNKNLTGRVKNFKQGTQLKVKGFVKHNLTTRYLLSNGHYITGNRKLVIAGNQKQPKQIKVKKAIYLYNNANFSKRTKHIKEGTVLKVKKWEYSHPYSTTTFGAKRYAVAGGYVTVNSHYVKVI
ncbi:MucBP domain-containing protein [Lentilactobacillus sp. IMAU92037]|nr:MucBP domain-containing protein [Lentilactobacillus dabitei]